MSDISNMYIDLPSKYPSVLSDFNETWTFSNIKCKENPSSGSRVVPRRWTGIQTETDRHDEANSRLSQCCETTALILQEVSVRHGTILRETKYNIKSFLTYSNTQSYLNDYKSQPKSCANQ